MRAEWAPFFGESDLRVFLTLVESELQTRGVPHELADGVVHLDVGGERESLGLGNLAETCAEAPIETWSQTIARHFELVFGRAVEEAELEDAIADFGRVADRLRVRLHGGSSLDEQVTRTLSQGIVANLVFDLPSSIRSVHRREADAWRAPDEALFRHALANLDREEAPEQTTLTGPDDVAIEVVGGESYYVAAHAMRLRERGVPDDHPYGALVAVPARHVFFFHVIEDARVLAAVRSLASLATEAFRRGPGAISDQVYWVRGDTWVHLPCTIEGGTLHVKPPPSFMKAVLERVVAPKS